MRDRVLIESLITELGCGRYVIRSDGNYGEFIVERFSDVSEKIIPMFEKYQLKGENRYDF